MIQRLINWLRHRDETIVPVLLLEERNYMEEVQDIRTKFKSMKIFVREVPVRKAQEIVGWKLTAHKGERSYMVEGADLLSAYQKLQRIFGLIK